MQLVQPSTNMNVRWSSQCLKSPTSLGLTLLLACQKTSVRVMSDLIFHVQELQLVQHFQSINVQHNREMSEVSMSNSARWHVNEALTACNRFSIYTQMLEKLMSNEYSTHTACRLYTTVAF